MMRRRFYADPNEHQLLEQAALTALLAATGFLLIELYQAEEERSWIALVVPGVVVLGALYAFLRARFVARLPVAEITDTHVRWRKPGQLMFSSVRLDGIVAAHWSAGQLMLLEFTGTTHEVPLKDMRFREGSFAIAALRSELERQIDPTSVVAANGRGA